MDKCPHCQGDLAWVKPRCLWCDREAVAFCDAALGQTMVDCNDSSGPRRVYTLTAPFFTCDAPMCSEHRKVVGFMCSKDDPETLDRCPVHAAADTVLADITEPDAVAMRREVQAAARRSRMATV